MCFHALRGEVLFIDGPGQRWKKLQKSVGSKEKSQTFVFHLPYYVSRGMPYYDEITKYYLKKKQHRSYTGSVWCYFMMGKNVF